MSPIFDVDTGRGVRVTRRRAERCYMPTFIGARCCEIDAMYDSFASNMSVYLYGEAPQLRPHHVWQDGEWAE